jgi:hypothetical protein
MAGIGFHGFAEIRALFHHRVEFRTAECSKCFILFGGFFLNSNIFFGEKTQTNDSDVEGISPDPVLVLNLDPGLNPDPSANPDPLTNLLPDPVEYRSGSSQKSGHESGSGYDSGSSFKTGSEN